MTLCINSSPGHRFPLKLPGWTLPTDISAPSLSNAKGAGYPVLAINGIGDGVVIWKEYDGTSMVIQGAGYSLGTWSFVFKTLST